MSWEPGQCERLALERAILRKFMSHLAFYNCTTDTYVEGIFGVEGTSNEYCLRVNIPSNYPHEKPGMFIVDPIVLPKYGGGTINQVGGGHAFHTGPNGPNGCVQICHTNNWDASLTLLQVFIKGALWLSGYHAHRETGRDIAAFFKERERTMPGRLP